MESNEDFALWAKRKANEAISLHDFTGAKEFLSLAKFLVPNVDGMEQMAAVVDVHLAGQLRVSRNEMDMYAVLQLDPSADDNTINEQYNKLALILNPDRNEVVGAGAAFKLIGEAFEILSDKGKRALHDMKRISFWTVCPSCKIAHHLPRKYENSELHCPSCRLGFVARDTGVDGQCTHNWTQSDTNVGAKLGSYWSSSQNGMASGGPRNTNNGLVNGGLSQPANICNPQVQTHGTTGYATASGGEFTHEMNKSVPADKTSEDMGKGSDREEMRKEKKWVECIMPFSPMWLISGRRCLKWRAKIAPRRGGGLYNAPVPKKFQKKERRKEKQRQKEKPKSFIMSRQGSKRSRGRVEEEDVEEHVHEGFSEATLKTQPRRSSRLRRASNYLEVDPDEVDSEFDYGVDYEDDPEFDFYFYPPSDADDPSFEEEEEELLVPSSLNLGADLLKESIKEGQIWATYDHDRLPRYYCQINKVHFAKPFRVWVKWLHPHRSTQTRMWLKAGFSPLPFGKFEFGHYIELTKIGLFSHVMCETTEGSLNMNQTSIYPQEGQVWAIYEDSMMPDWSSLTKITVHKGKRKYEVVLVVKGFSEGTGLDFIFLHKVYGNGALFEKINGPAKHIPSQEIVRFSHMIPAYQLKGDEAPNIPKECWELDPMALPADHRIVNCFYDK